MRWLLVFLIGCTDGALGGGKGEGGGDEGGGDEGGGDEGGEGGSGGGDEGGEAPGCSSFEGQGDDWDTWALPDFGTPGSGYDWDAWFMEGSDRYTDGLNWFLSDLTGDGAPDLVITYQDEYVRDAVEADQLGRASWLVYENTGDSFKADPMSWTLPDFGTPGSGYDWDAWFLEGSDRYTDGLNWFLSDLTGDGAPDLVITWQDEYVREEAEADQLGRASWLVYENQGDGFSTSPQSWTLPDFGAPASGYSWDAWFKTGYDHYTDGLNWSLTDLTGDGAPDLVVTWQDEYVREEAEADKLGRASWLLYKNQGDGFATSGQSWTLPDFGTPDGYTWDAWFKTSYDYYTDGLNWSLTDLTGDGAPDLVVTWQDDYVREEAEADKLGRASWLLYENQGDGFATSGQSWTLPDFGTPGSGYSWDAWFKASYDYYSDGLNWSLLDLSGDGAPDLVVTWQDENVREQVEADKLGRASWLLYENQGDGFVTSGQSWALPDLGTPDGYTWDAWFKLAYDTYSDGLNWSVMDLDGDGGTDLVIYDQDSYVRETLDQDGLGRSAWAVYRAACVE